MLDDQRPGSVYWIDHYVVPTADPSRWSAFYTNVFGAQSRAGEEAPNRAVRGARALFTWVGNCHVGGSSHEEALEASSGLPRYTWFVRPENVDEHLRRLDVNGVPHSGPIRTSEDGEDGRAIRFADPDGNQLEFWAPSRMPDGAMDGETPAKVGRISAAVFASRDLGRAADFYSRYCRLDALRSDDVSEETLVLPLAAGGRLVFKQVEALGNRTLGHCVYRALHTALVVRDDEFLPSLERMYRDLPEWDFDPEDPPTLSHVEAGVLPARTCIHGSPIGPEWKRSVGRGDSFCDWDTNGYHFVGAAPVDGSMASFEPVSQRVFLERRTASSASA
ncbi:MAG: hypothetical protein GEU73_16760 [Chloroflexi bacterium]|nr:hypothetical protein [Chloroflexota bacterium]